MLHRIRFSFSRGNELQYLSHLDLMRLFMRALRRASLPLAYSRGYNPHPRLSLASPLPLGVTASAEYGEIFLTMAMDCAYFTGSLGEQLPAGLELTGAVAADLREPSLAAVVNAALYRAAWARPGNAPKTTVLNEALVRMLSRPAIEVRRPGSKGREKVTDIRPFIMRVETVAETENGHTPALELLLQVGSRGGVSPITVLEQLDLGPGYNGDAAFPWRLHRHGLYIYRKNRLEKPF